MAEKVDLKIDAGTNFSYDFQLVNENSDPINLSSYSVYSSFKRNYSSSFKTDFIVTTNNNQGIITLILNPSDTNSLAPGYYVYDIVLNSSNNIFRPVEGIVTINAAVTNNQFYVVNNANNY